MATHIGIIEGRHDHPVSEYIFADGEIDAHLNDQWWIEARILAWVESAIALEGWNRMAHITLPHSESVLPYIFYACGVSKVNVMFNNVWLERTDTPFLMASGIPPYTGDYHYTRCGVWGGVECGSREGGSSVALDRCFGYRTRDGEPTDEWGTSPRFTQEEE